MLESSPNRILMGRIPYKHKLSPDSAACQSGLLKVSLPDNWEWLCPGGCPGLQNRWRAALRAAGGSTPIHSRLCAFSGRR